MKGWFSSSKEEDGFILRYNERSTYPLGSPIGSTEPLKIRLRPNFFAYLSQEGRKSERDLIPSGILIPSNLQNVEVTVTSTLYLDYKEDPTKELNYIFTCFRKRPKKDNYLFQPPHHMGTIRGDKKIRTLQTTCLFSHLRAEDEISVGINVFQPQQESTSIPPPPPPTSLNGPLYCYCIAWSILLKGTIEKTQL